MNTKPRGGAYDDPEIFRLLVQAIRDYAIFVLDSEGYIQTWNEGAQRLKGYSASDIIGKHFSIFYTQDALERGWPAHELKAAAREGRFEDEGWRVRKDGSRFWANVIITALRKKDGSLYGFSKVTRDFTERRLAQTALAESERKLRESESSLRELSAHLLRSQDEERRRIGRDLHDSLGQYLIALKMKLEGLTDLNDTSQLIQDIEQCVSITEQSIKEVRTISYLLYPPMLEENGLKSAIGWFLDGFAKRSSIRSNLQIDSNFDRLPIDVELALFRVIQESLTNVHRHSGSPTVDISLAMEDGKAVVEVRDQGKGLPASMRDGIQPGIVGVGGVGLRGMKERMLQIGGTFDVTSASSGTIVRATVPIGPSGTKVISKSQKIEDLNDTQNIDR